MNHTPRRSLLPFVGKQRQRVGIETYKNRRFLNALVLTA